MNKIINILIFGSLLFTGCATTDQAFKGGSIKFNINGVPYVIKQAEAAAKPATAVVTEKREAKGEVITTTVDMATGTSQKDLSKAYAAFKDWRTYGGIMFVIGIFLCVWSPIPAGIGLAMVAAGAGMALMSHLIPAYGGYIGLACVIGVFFGLVMWLHGLKTDPKKDMLIKNSKAISAIAKSYGEQDNGQ